MKNRLKLKKLKIIKIVKIFNKVKILEIVYFQFFPNTKNLELYDGSLDPESLSAARA